MENIAGLGELSSVNSSDFEFVITVSSDHKLIGVVNIHPSGIVHLQI